MSCPNCGAPGGGPSGCGSCGLGKDPNVGGAFNAGQDQLREQQNSNRDNGCFPGDSLILTPYGYKTLVSLKKGDIILGISSEGNTVETSIKRVDSHKPHRLISVHSEAKGYTFRATKKHPVKTHRGWVPVKDLRIGDELVYVSEGSRVETHKVQNISQVKGAEPVYNLVVDGDHTFVVKGCLAHSFVSFRALRCFLSKFLNIIVCPLHHTDASAQS